MASSDTRPFGIMRLNPDDVNEQMWLREPEGEESYFAFVEYGDPTATLRRFVGVEAARAFIAENLEACDGSFHAVQIMEPTDGK